MPKPAKSSEICPVCQQFVQPDSTVAVIHMTMSDNGAVSIQGNVGDVHLAMAIIDAGREAVKRLIGKPCGLEPHGRGIKLSPNDVDAKPNERLYPLVAKGDQR